MQLARWLGSFGAAVLVSACSSGVVEQSNLGAAGAESTAPSATATETSAPLPTETAPAMPMPAPIRQCTPGPTIPIASPDMPADGDGNRTLDVKYWPTPEFSVNPTVPHGAVIPFTMNSAESKIFPGRNNVPFMRRVWVYVPVGYVPGTPAPFIVVQDGVGYSDDIPNVLDSLIPGKCLPKMIGIMVENGPGGQRSLEYDSVSDAYARFLETELFPRVEKEANVVLTTDPEGGATLGGSSGGAAAFTLGWFRPERFRRIITYSGSYVALRKDAMHPNGAWDYHASLIPNNPPKPLRVWLESTSGDTGPADAKAPNLDWQTANQNMYSALNAKGIHVQHNFAPGAGHNDPYVLGGTLVDALIWLWRGYPVE